ncbi:hypothetical protein [Rhizobium leguminosarum]|uniref:hypothetical protein n=1 Tax=Rhizobium leguminosarum TaxID=384 RepID=UPI0012BB96AA|nr:hypothetical protein [Rhizobium leguminosarum]MBY5325517.1 hypothetical protein [Rhizobium leguminosarum]MBY5381392.1 hypothetical protein [Rhizobium leguminosarum]NEH46201.1 hypothetical protein [Rhizobium leguminosarum]
MTGITGKLAKLRNAARVSISAKGIAKAAKKRRFLRFADEIISVPKLDTGHALGMFEPWWAPVGQISVGSHSRADLFDGNPRRIELRDDRLEPDVPPRVRFCITALVGGQLTALAIMGIRR